MGFNQTLSSVEEPRHVPHLVLLIGAQIDHGEPGNGFDRDQVDPSASIDHYEQIEVIGIVRCFPRRPLQGVGPVPDSNLPMAVGRSRGRALHLDALDPVGCRHQEVVLLRFGREGYRQPAQGEPRGRDEGRSVTQRRQSGVVRQVRRGSGRFGVVEVGDVYAQAQRVALDSDAGPTFLDQTKELGYLRPRTRPGDCCSQLLVCPLARTREMRRVQTQCLGTSPDHPDGST